MCPCFRALAAGKPVSRGYESTASSSRRALAVDNDAVVSKAYGEAFAGQGTQVITASVADAEVAAMLRGLAPHVVSVSPPCTDYASCDGVVRDGEAASCTTAAVDSIIKGRVRFALLENVRQMLLSVTWRKAKQRLIESGYAVFIGGAARRAAGLPFAEGARLLRHCAHAPGSARGAAAFWRPSKWTYSRCKPTSMIAAVPDLGPLIFLKPRVKGKKGVYSTAGLLPSPVRRFPGVVGEQYEPSAADDGPVAEAKVPTHSQLARLMSYDRPLPQLAKQRLSLMIANLVMPTAAAIVLRAADAAGIP